MNLRKYGVLNVRVKSGNRVNKEPEMSGLRLMYSYYKKNARVKGLVFNILFEEFRKIVKRDCVYCGSPPANIVKAVCKETSAETIAFGSATVNGIDRIDSKIGYEVDNVQPCCKRCNYMKWTLTEKEFLDHAEKITAHTRTKART